MPVKVTYQGKTKVTRFKRLEFTKTLKRNMEVQQRQATRAWLREVLKHIPTYTGTARGTFKPLGRVLRVAVPKIGPKGARGNLKQARRKTEFRYRGQVFQLGFDKGGDYSDFKFEQKETTEELIYTFTFNNRLLYLLWNDIFPAPQWITLPSNPPWRAVEQGNRAWNEYVRNEVPRKIPKVKDHLVIVNA